VAVFLGRIAVTEVVIGEACSEKGLGTCLNEIVLWRSCVKGGSRCGACGGAVFEQLVTCNACEGGVER
jgi:hypothetical protein